MKLHLPYGACFVRRIQKLLGWIGIVLLLLQSVACSSLKTPASYQHTHSTQESSCNSANPSSYTVRGHRYHVLKTSKGYDKVGYASWYGKELNGHRTFSNERYNMYSYTAASTTLPIPCLVRVTNLKNGRSVIVRINDRGPFRGSRIIDLSYAAAKELGYAGRGTTLVRVTAV